MQLQPLDRMFLALADPNRRGMVEQLSDGPATVKQLAAPAGMRLPSAVKHLKVLEESGIVISNKVGRTRTYTIQANALRTIGDWARKREAAWNAAFDRLAAAMQILEEEPEQ
ncbi:ArsR/SmtB family transcription factor [Ensifer aridi]|uniref:ArsR/SmtB family transcription factor n=1 Tax=Ensifer aridi TaxID=1708715 RepID=UPI00040AAD2D|nr:metalloregulator ArsR/SmtB family transcription factor [Ensifer aridi]